MKTAHVILLTCFLPAAVPTGAAEGEGAYSIRIKGRGFDERCVRLDAGESIRYRFSSSVPVDFNVHYHRDKDVFYPVKASASRAAEASFTAPHADTYCLMWEHGGPGDVTVEGTLEKLPPKR